jgi:metal-sulfur cluster biosynthetic enzyme
VPDDVIGEKLIQRGHVAGGEHLVYVHFLATSPRCPVIDPVSRSARLSPVGTYADTQTITAATCPGDEYLRLQVTGPAGHLLARRTAHLTVTPPG